MMGPDSTLVAMFLHRVEVSGSQDALWERCDGRFRATTWRQLADEASRLAVVLEQWGVAPGDRVVQIAENRREWIVCDQAILMALGVHVPLHTSLAGHQLVEQIADSGARVVVVSTTVQLEKLAACRDRLPAGIRFITYEKSPGAPLGKAVTSWHALREEVKEGQSQGMAQRALAALSPEMLATILYTSGTTGEPKGVMLTHGNLTSNVRAVLASFDQHADDLRLCFLPFSHIFARTCELYTWIAGGSRLALSATREAILPDCAEIRPTLITGVPYFFRRIHQRLLDVGQSQQTGSLQCMLGGRLRACFSGGAALSDADYDFFVSQGIPVYQGYGLTETSPVVSTATPSAVRRGSVGKPVDSVDVRIDDDGEVLVRGPNVMAGFWQRPEATRQVIQGGWFHTGDIGHQDSDGFLFITGRKKDLIVTATGKNIAPAHLENLLCQDPLILQAVVVGDGRNYLTALIVPDPQKLRGELISRRIFAFSKKRIVSHPRVVELYAQRIQQRLACVSQHEQIRKFTIMDRGFTIESGEMTPKLSLRRSVIMANCSPLIEAMYRDEK